MPSGCTRTRWDTQARPTTERPPVSSPPRIPCLPHRPPVTFLQCTFLSTCPYHLPRNLHIKSDRRARRPLPTRCTTRRRPAASTRCCTTSLPFSRTRPRTRRPRPGPCPTRCPRPGPNSTRNRTRPTRPRNLHTIHSRRARVRAPTTQ